MVVFGFQIEEVNHDTITSLHGFMNAARVVQRSLMALGSGNAGTKTIKVPKLRGSA